MHRQKVKINKTINGKKRSPYLKNSKHRLPRLKFAKNEDFYKPLVISVIHFKAHRPNSKAVATDYLSPCDGPSNATPLRRHRVTIEALWRCDG